LVLENVDIAVAKNNITLLCQPTITFAIAPIVDVLASVRFDNYFPAQTNEIDNVRTDRRLTSEFRASEAPISQKQPKLTLGIRLFATHAACAGGRKRRSFVSDHAPSRGPAFDQTTLSPSGERVTCGDAGVKLTPPCAC
jgi:hypothetical protein